MTAPVQQTLIDVPRPPLTAQQLGSVLKSARDIMRKDKGLNGDIDRLPVLTWVMFLKFLDDLERQREEEADMEGLEFRPAIDAPYRWRDWAARPDGISGDDLLAFINQDVITHPDDTKSPGLFAYLRGLQSSDDERRKVVARVFFRPSISADSQLIAFTSDATLLENDQNRTDDVFVYQLDQAELLPSRDQRCFPETGQCMAEDFARYWEAQGGLPVFGYPIAPATGEQNRDLKTLYLTQWFERNRFEQHQENQPPYRVLLGRLGDERLRQLGRDWQQEPRAAGPQIGCLWFEATRHNVCNQGNGSEGPLGFLRYWRDHGLEFDGQPGASYEESLALFGLPLSEPSLETNSSGDTVLTQWFERARFEWHPGKPDEYKVLLFPLSSFLFPLFSFLFSLSSFLFPLFSFLWYTNC